MADDGLPLETFDASDAVAENNARRDAARIQREDADVLRTVLHTKKGRAWLLRRLDGCGINSPAKFAAGAPDQTAFNLGRESVGAELLQSVLAASADLYMKAIAEQQEEERRLAEVRRKERETRETADQPVRAADLVSELPPPDGWPGGKPLPAKPKRK